MQNSYYIFLSWAIPSLDEGGHGVEWIKIANDVKLIVGCEWMWPAMQLRLHRHVQLHTTKALLRIAQIFRPGGSREVEEIGRWHLAQRIPCILLMFKQAGLPGYVHAESSKAGLGGSRRKFTWEWPASMIGNHRSCPGCSFFQLFLKYALMIRTSLSLALNPKGLKVISGFQKAICSNRLPWCSWASPLRSPGGCRKMVPGLSLYAACQEASMRPSWAILPSTLFRGSNHFHSTSLLSYNCCVEYADYIILL